MWRPLEHHSNLGDASPQALAGTQVERHTRPPTIVDIEAYCGICLSVGIWVDAGFLQVPDYLNTALPSMGILAACGVASEIGRKLNRPQDLFLLGAHIIRRK